MKYNFFILIIMVLSLGIAFGGMYYINNGDGTVQDLDTGLTWTRCGLLAGEEPDTTDQCAGIKGLYTWGEAIQACENLELAGVTDWRLPNIRELHSIVTYSYEDYPMTDSEAFPNIYNADRSLSHYWSSTSHQNNTDYAYRLDASMGTVAFAHKDNVSENSNIRVFARCVSGPD